MPLAPMTVAQEGDEESAAPWKVKVPGVLVGDE